MTTDDTIAQKISRILADRIVTGSLPPGTKLRQDHIAEEFDTSHVPVREALRRLEAQGLAISEPRRGVRVASFSKSEVEEVARMRAVLEGLALRHAAPHLTRAILDQAEEVTKKGDKAANLTEQEESNKQFHGLLLAPCGMPRLLAQIDDLHMVASRFMFVMERGHWAPRIDLEHHAILRHLRAGQIEGAVHALQRHILRLTEAPVAKSN